VFGFGGELRQLFANLIGNALDAMPNGGSLRLRVRGGHGPKMDGTWCKGVCITVADTGIGMSEETRRRIFEAFFTTKEATGTGLGLWVSEEIVRKHSGTMRVKSRQDDGKSGTSFMIFLPDGEG
jgi:signal transduction histidine kinase